METIFLFFIVFIFGIAWILDKFRGNSKSYHLPRQHSKNSSSNDVLPSGYTRNDYKNYGFTDFDIEFLGLDQPGAPEPPVAGWVLLDLIDGELDGEFEI